MRLFLLILLPVVLMACSSNDNVIPPSPVPQIKSEIEVEKLWELQVGDGVGENYLSLKPAVTSRWVFAVSGEGVLVKLDRLTGKRQWKQNLERRITGGIAAGYGMLALGTANGELLVLDEESGELLWEKRLSGQIMSTPAFGSNRVVAQTIDGRLHGLNREDGASAWVFDTIIPVLTLRGESSPVVNGEVTLAGFANGKLVALETETGAVGWDHLIGESQGRSELERLIDLDGRFWVSDKVVYAVTYQGSLAAIDIPTGRVLWNRTLSSYAGVSEYLSRLYAVDENSVVMAMDTISGSDIWEQDKLKGRRLSAPTAYDDYVLVGDYEGFLYWLSYQDGRFLARVKVGVKKHKAARDRVQSLHHLVHATDGLRVEPVVYEEVIYVQANSGELAAYKVVEEE